MSTSFASLAAQRGAQERPRGSSACQSRAVAWLGPQGLAWVVLLLVGGLASRVDAQSSKPSASKPSDVAKPGGRGAGAARPVPVCPEPVAVPAAIDDPLADEFRVHYQLAVELYRARDYAAAIPEMQRAYKLKPVARLLYNLGQAHRKLSQPREAITYFELYLQTDSLVPAEIDAEVRGYLIELRALLAEQERARVVLVARKNPPPRWLRPLGGTLMALGVAGIAAGAPLWAVNGSCTAPPVPPMQTCDQVFATLPLGATLVGVGGGLFLTGLGMVLGSVRRGKEAGEGSTPSGDRAPAVGTASQAPAALPPSPPTPARTVPVSPSAPASADPDVEPAPAPLQLSLR